MSKFAIRTTLVALTVWAALVLAQAQTPKLTVIHSFTSKADGATPSASVILDENGNIYGTASFGGKNSNGTVFKIDAKGKLSVLHQFIGSDGAEPLGGLVRDSQGNLYGTAADGGNFYGTAFKIDRSGKFSVLHYFGPQLTDARNPAAGLILDRNGNLYGTVSAGGAHGLGGVFRLDKKGNEKTLYSFGPFPDGLVPFSDLIRDRHGNLYGTTSSGGTTDNGTVFRLDSAGQETELFSFPGGNEGEAPRSGVIQDSGGNWYGTTVGLADLQHFGTAYKLDSSGVQTVLQVFTGGADGGHPFGKLVMDRNGNLYGPANRGGAFNQGVIFKIDSAGNYSILHSFSGPDGALPYAGLVFDAKGNLYGTTADGGKFGWGTVFKLTNP